VALYIEAGFFDQEGRYGDLVHDKIIPRVSSSPVPTASVATKGGTMVRDMIAYNIDVIPDVHVRTPLAERA
jgi:hypothetical protein